MMLCASAALAEDGTPVIRRPASRGAAVSPDAVVRADSAPNAGLERLQDRLKQQLETLTGRWRNDSRVQTASTIVGLGAAAVGATQGKQAIAFAGTHAVRWGLGPQLRVMKQRSGFLIAPSVGRHHFVITARKIFE
jgi:hypothetical protein